MRMKRFVSIRRKVAIIILVSLTSGVGVVVFYFAHGQNAALHLSTQGNLFQQADILHQSIKSVMLPGEAPLAVALFNGIQTTNPMYRITLYRHTGAVAFSDNSTLDQVNQRLGMARFYPKDVMLTGAPLDPADPLFASAVQNGRTASFPHTAQAKSYLTIYKPLLNLPKCTPCHGVDHTIRGVIAIQADLTPIFAQTQHNLIIAALIFIGIVALLFTILSVFLKRTVIAPIQRIGYVAAEVTKGNFQEKVQIQSADEIGALGQQINTMVDGLYERYELSKFVSASTIQSLKNSAKGSKTEMTMFFSDIRGFTSFSERVTPEVVVEHLNQILTIQTDIIHRYGGDIDKYVGDEIVALFTGPAKEHNACLAALEIQQYLTTHPTELTGLMVGIGINTGEVILGMIGSQKRADFTVIGDHVNFASRLCSEAKGGKILLSDSTFQPIRADFEVDGPFEIRVKGKEQPHSVYLC